MVPHTIEKQAEEILKKLNITAPPINLQKVAEENGIIISEAPNNNDNLSGLLLKSNGKTIIGVNALHSKNRKRFTIAHELGHFFRHQEEDTFLDEHSDLDILKFRHDGMPKTAEESEANSFAAALLMPREMIKKHFDAIKEINDTDKIVHFLAELYEVSNDAMKYRLLNLSFIK